MSVLTYDGSNCADATITFGSIDGPEFCGGHSEAVEVYIDDLRVCDILVHYSSALPLDPYSIKWPVHHDSQGNIGFIRECVQMDNGPSTYYQQKYLDHFDALHCRQEFSLVEPTWCDPECGLIGVSYEQRFDDSLDFCANEIFRSFLFFIRLKMQRSGIA